MSEFFAEAQVLVRPNTVEFAATLRAQLEAAVAKVGPIAVPVIAAPTTAGAAAATSELVAANEAAAASAVGLASATQVENSALGKQTALLGTATAAQEAETAVTKTAVAANEAAAASLAAMAKAAAGAGAVEARLATAQEAAALTTTHLAAARAVLRVTSGAVAIAESNLNKALRAKNIALIDAAANELTLAKAEEANAVSAVKAAIAQERESAAALGSAHAHSQATRGIIAQSASFAGLRAGTLAASAPFIAATASTIIFAKAIREASSETEELNKTAVVFGQSSAQIQEFARTTANSLGISTVEALKATGIFGNLFRTIKISQPVAADMSERLVRLASDLASFNNADPSRTLDALRSGLVGQARPLRVFGVFLSQARAQQQALIDTGKKSVKELTNAEIVQARFNIILRDSAIAQGDFARTSDRLANQSRILKANLADLEAELGRKLLPVLGLVVSAAIDYVQAFKRMDQATQDFAGHLPLVGPHAEGAAGKLQHLAGEVTKTYAKVVVLGPALFGVTTLMDKFGIASENAGKKLTIFDLLSGRVDNALVKLAGSLERIQTSSLKGLTGQLNQLEVQALKIETGLAPGGRAAEEANLRRQIAADKKAVALSKSGTAARKTAIQELKNDQDALAALQEQDAQDAKDRAQRIKDAAAAQKKAAEDAAKAQADAIQAFIDSFSSQQTRLQNRLSKAQLLGNAKQQIEINKQIVAADRAEINAIKARIRHMHLHGDALKIAQQAIAALNQEIFNTRNAIQQLVAQRQQAIIDARQSHLEAQLAIAETTASVKDDRAAEKALIAFDRAQIARLRALKKRRGLTLDEAAQLDAYRVDLAQRNAALKKATDELKKTKNAMAAMQFEFLQIQSGFAANLLGNLIPGSATSGLVGGTTAPPASSAAATALLGARPNTPTEDVRKTTATLAGGPTRGGQATQNQLLRHIAHLLDLIYRGTGHPEAKHRQSRNLREMDLADHH